MSRKPIARRRSPVLIWAWHFRWRYFGGVVRQRGALSVGLRLGAATAACTFLVFRQPHTQTRRCASATCSSRLIPPRQGREQMETENKSGPVRPRQTERHYLLQKQPAAAKSRVTDSEGPNRLLGQPRAGQLGGSETVRAGHRASTMPPLPRRHPRSFPGTARCRRLQLAASCHIGSSAVASNASSQAEEEHQRPSHAPPDRSQPTPCMTVAQGGPARPCGLA